MKITIKEDILSHLKEVGSKVEEGHCFWDDDCYSYGDVSSFPRTITYHHLKKLIDVEYSDGEKAIEIANKWVKGKVKREELYEDIKRAVNQGSCGEKYPNPFVDNFIGRLKRDFTYRRKYRNGNREAIENDIQEAYKEELEIYQLIRYLLQPFATKTYLEQVSKLNDRHLKEVETLLEGVKDIRELKLEDLPARKDEEGRYI